MADAPISEELTALKKRARRRLVGAIALMLIALLVLWSVMDNKPPASLSSQPVSIVSSEASLVSTVKPESKPAATSTTPVPGQTKPTLAPARVQDAPAPLVVPTVPAPNLAELRPAPNAAANASPAPVAPLKPVIKATPDTKPATRPEPVKKVEPPAPKKDPARILAGLEEEAPSQPKHDKLREDAAGGHFFLQFGAFADETKVKDLQAKAHAAGVNVQAEAVSTDKGRLTRLRAGPFASHDAAQKAQSRLDSAGVHSSIVGK
jgi:DedD protein